VNNPRTDRRAACANYPDLSWFTDTQKPADARAAISVCLHCPIQAACLTWALWNGEREGIWGGLSAKKREKMRASLWRMGAIKGHRQCEICGDPYEVAALNSPARMCSSRCRRIAARRATKRRAVSA
jgi:WhiB family redox-sensing transcriptional regulator